MKKAKDLGLNPEESRDAANALSKLTNPDCLKAFGFDPETGMPNTDIAINYLNEDNFGFFSSKNFNEFLNNIEKAVKEDPKDPKDPNKIMSPKEQNALIKYLQNNAKKFRKNTRISLPDNIRTLAKEFFEDTTDKTKGQKLSNWFNSDEFKNLVRDNEERLNNNETINTPDGENKPRSNKKLFMALMLLMEIGASLGVLLYLLISHANANTGCMKFEYNSSTDSYIKSTKVFCNNDKTTYYPLMCYCKSTVDFGKCSHTASKYSCPEKINSATESQSEPRPVQQNNSCCKGSETSLDNYLYYAYQVMDPASAGIDIVDKAAKVADHGIGELLQIIINAAIWLGAIFGVLLVLWTIYKLVANRKPAETLKIQEVAPGASQFGKGFLGNLSKYNNYANMGRCTTFNSRPYMPARFKMPNYKF